MDSPVGLGPRARAGLAEARRLAGRVAREATTQIASRRGMRTPAQPTATEQRAASEPTSPYPASFDLAALRENHPDLARFDDAALLAHYRRIGHDEGRKPFLVVDRNAFVGLLDAGAHTLEIGPFQAPMLTGPNVRYFDVLDRTGLVERAESLGLDTSRIPETIHVVSPTGDLSIVTDRFDAVVSSHAIEHQPDLVRHLRHVADLLVDGGRYFVLVPDHRFCFDHFLAPTPTAAVLEAHLEARTRHPARAVLEHRAHTTHNDAGAHWAGDHGQPAVGRPDRLRAAMQELAEAGEEYIDVHAWQFTPDSFAEVFEDLGQLGLSPFEIERLYPTTRGQLEFWAILRKR